MIVASFSKTIRLILVDDHEMVREVLASMLEEESDLTVVGQCSSSAEALVLLHSQVDMVLLDADLGGERAIGFVEAARKSDYDGQFLVVTSELSDVEAVRLLQAGVTGIIHKKQSATALCEAIRKVATGEPYIEERYVQSLIRSLDRSRPPVVPKLTERDRALLRHLSTGLTNREIAEALEVSEAVVKASLRLLFEKVNVRSRLQLVRLALEQYRDQL